MEKTWSSPLSYLISGLSPLRIKFEIVDNGIEVHLYKRNRQIEHWQPWQLDRVAPEPLKKWIAANHLHEGPQPYPLIKQLWQALLPLASRKLLIDSSALAELEEISQPADFALNWSINHHLLCFEGRFAGADQYLGMGWFKRGTNIYHLHKPISTTVDSQLKTLQMPLQFADYLVDSIIPYLHQFFPTSADFQLINDFELHVKVPEAQFGSITLTLESNYPQLLPTIQIPPPDAHILVAKQAILRFNYQSMTPTLARLLQGRGLPLKIQGEDVPFFVADQLPVMRQFDQITTDLAAKITASNPVVSIATIKPTPAFINKQDSGVGFYELAATYQYQQLTIDMTIPLAARQYNHRFIQYQTIWLEWPKDSRELANTIQNSLTRQTLWPDEVMGFNTHRLASVNAQAPAFSLTPVGKSLNERAKSILEQSRYHGIPGGIVGEPRGLTGMLVNACERLLQANQMARILWLVPSNKKGSVTRAFNGSSASSAVTVASPATLRNEQALTTQEWTLVIFQELDSLSEDAQSNILARLTWKWAFFSVTEKQTFNPGFMPIMHLSEQYYDQFSARYLYDLEKKGINAIASQPLPDQKSTEPAPTPQPTHVNNIQPTSTILPTPISQPAPTLQPAPATQPSQEEKATSSSLPPTTPASALNEVAPLPTTPLPPKSSSHRNSLPLDQKRIASLHEESDQLQIRLTVEEEESQILAEALPQPVASLLQPAIVTEPDPIPATPIITTGAAPAVDDDWQTIQQQWQPEHWEIIQLLYQGQSAQLAAVGRRFHRPVSRLIDEANAPVEELLGDLLIDPDTQTISPHLEPIANILINWYDTSNR